METTSENPSAPVTPSALAAACRRRFVELIALDHSPESAFAVTFGCSAEAARESADAYLATPKVQETLRVMHAENTAAAAALGFTRRHLVEFLIGVIRSDGPDVEGRRKARHLLRSLKESRGGGEAPA